MARLKTGRHTSALKAARQAAKRHWANAASKDEVKKITKSLLESIAKKDAAKAKELLPKVASLWARLGHRKVLHHAAASRKIARLSKAVHRLTGAHA